MAHITLTGTLLNPNGVTAAGDKIRFTHKSTTGQTVEGAVSILTIIPSGLYSVDLQYGTVLVEYCDSGSPLFKNVGVVTVNSTNVATTIPQLLGSAVPPSSSELILFQAILAQSLTAQSAAEAAVDAAAAQVEAAAAQVEAAVVQVEAAEAAAASVASQFQTDTGAGLIGTAAGTSLQANLNALTAGQVGGIVVFTTYTLLDAYTPTTAQQSASFKVTNDSNTSLNGYYHWVSGTAYAKDAELSNGIIESGNADAVSGDTVFNAIDAGLSSNGTIDIAPLGYAWSVVDGFGSAAIGVKDDGTFSANSMEVLTINDTAVGSLNNLETIKRVSPQGYAWGVMDESFNLAVGVKDDGTFISKEMETSTLNNINVNALISAAFRTPDSVVTDGNFNTEISMILSYGQSLSVGADGVPPISLVQSYDNISFSGGVITQLSSDPYASLIPMVEAPNETPVSGSADMIKELIQTENGINHTEQNYQILGSAPGSGGAKIYQLVKGQASYTRFMEDVAAGYALSSADGKIFKTLAFWWTQGESDYANNTTSAEYKSDLIGLRNDIDADTKAITGQDEDVACISYQTQAHGTYGHVNDAYIAVAQWQVANENENHHVACPLYWSEQRSHQSNQNYKILGAYYGICYKRVVIDGLPFKPLQPKAVTVQNNIALIRFDVPVGNLQFDGDLKSLQTDKGFTVVNSGNSTYTIDSVEIVGEDLIKIVTSTPITAGSKLRYGFGNGGNIRDQQGETVIFNGEGINHPMHNWLVIFEWII